MAAQGRIVRRRQGLVPVHTKDTFPWVAEAPRWRSSSQIGDTGSEPYR